MATFRSIKELTRALQQGSKLLNNMFLQRKTVAVKYDDALDTLDGDENKLKHLVTFGVIVQTGDSLELDDAYQRFFEDVLVVNEDINISSVKMYIDKLNLGISSYLAAENNARRESFLREIRHTFRGIDNATRRNVIDLKRNVDDTYKQEPNFKIKELRLKNFDEKARLIGELIRQTERVIDEQTIFFSSAADYGLKQTVSEVRDGLRESAHGLIAITAQIIEYLNRIEYQSRLVKRVRQLKYLRDQFMIEQATNVKELISQKNAVWMERQPKYITRVSLSIPNQYVHFGDLDLAGIAIYESEYYHHLGNKSSLFIPDDFEQRISNGNAERYNVQLPQYGKMKVEDKRVQPLLDSIHLHHKGYDQEGYIKTKNKEYE